MEEDPAPPPPLRRLHLDDDAADRFIPDVLRRNTDVQELRLSSRSLSPLDLECVAALVRSPRSRLRSLALFRCSGVGDRGAALLADAWARSRTLRSLELPYCDVGPEGARRVADAVARAARAPPGAVTAVDLAGNNISGEGVLAVLGSLRGRERGVERLNLRHCGIAHRAGRDVVDSLGKMTSLRSLALTCVRIGDAGARAVSSLLRRPGCRLEGADLQHCGLGPAGASSLASALKANASLRRLVLTGDEVGKAGLRSFVPVLRECNHTLERLAVPDHDERRRERDDKPGGRQVRLLLSRYTDVNARYSALEAEARKTGRMPRTCLGRTVAAGMVPEMLAYLAGMNVDDDGVRLGVLFGWVRERHADLFVGGPLRGGGAGRKRKPDSLTFVGGKEGEGDVSDMV